MHIENGRADLKSTKEELPASASQPGATQEEKTESKTIDKVRAVVHRDARRSLLTAVLCLVAVYLLYSNQDIWATLAIALAGFTTGGQDGV